MKKLLLSMALVAGATTMASATTVTFDFVNNDYGMTRLSGSTSEYNADPTTAKSGDVTLTLSSTQGSESKNGSGTRLWSDGLRFYNGGQMTITANANIKKVTIVGAKAAAIGTFSSTPTGYDTATGVWSGDAASVVIKYTPTSANSAIKTLTIEYGEGSGTVEPGPGDDPEPNKGLTLLDETSATGAANWTLSGTFTSSKTNETLDIWTWTSYNSAYYLNGSAYGAAETSVEGWAISPVVTMDADAKSVSFEHAAKFQTTLKEDCGFFVRLKGATTWTQLTIPTYPEAGAWTWANSGDIDVAAYAGKEVEFGYKYAGTDTWEIRNLVVPGTVASTPVTPPVEPEVVTVTSVADMLSCATNTKVKVDCALNIAFISKNNVFAVDEAGDAIQLYGAHTYTVNDLLPKGWEATYMLHNGVTPELTPGADGFPAATGTKEYVAPEITDGVVTTSDVNRVLMIKNVKFDEATPGPDVTDSAAKNFTGESAGKTLSFRNNYAVESVPAGTYDVKVMTSVYQGAPSLYVIEFKSISSGVSTIDAENGAAVIYDMMGRRVKANDALKGIYIINGKKVIF